MPARKRKKNSRLRGSHTHGWGEKKKHRNAGHKGGKGRSGSGKRGDQKKPSFWALGRPGKHGFISRSTTQVNPINIQDVTLMIDHGKFEKKGTAYVVNLTALGYTKLLSKGTVKYPMQVTVDTAVEKAVAKVAEKGGNVAIKATTQE